ncbi:hypothetical protein ACF0H5_018463 [Mactra antiquata]
MGSAASRKQNGPTTTNDDIKEVQENGDSYDLVNYDVINQETRSNITVISSDTQSASGDAEFTTVLETGQSCASRIRPTSNGIRKKYASDRTVICQSDKQNVVSDHSMHMQSSYSGKSSPEGAITKPEQAFTIRSTPRTRNKTHSTTLGSTSYLSTKKDNHSTNMYAEKARTITNSKYTLKSTKFASENHNNKTASTSRYNPKPSQSISKENGKLDTDNDNSITKGSEWKVLSRYETNEEKSFHVTASDERANQILINRTDEKLDNTERLNLTVHADECSTRVNDIEAASSLGSTTLEYDLSNREESDVTVSDYFPLSSADSFTGTRLRMKFGLLDWYRTWGFDIPKFPLLPEYDSTYLTPWMTRRKSVENIDDLNDMVTMSDADKDNFMIDKRITSFKEIFDKRNIFLAGDHGVGKSLFLRYIIKCWVDVHTEKEIEKLRNVSNETLASELDSNERDTLNSIDDASSLSSQYTSSIELVNPNKERFKHLHREYVENMTKSTEEKIEVLDDLDELLKYDFVFFISLKHGKEQTDIYKLIEMQYKHLIKYLGLEGETYEEIITYILDNEHEKCLILVDDLDDWRPRHRQYKSHIKSNGLPNYNHHKMFTMLWTLTPLNLKQLNYQLRFPDLHVSFLGIDAETTKYLFDIVSSSFDVEHRIHTRVDVEDCYQKIHNSYLRKFERFPYTFQTILCVYHETGKLYLRNVYCQLLNKQFSCFQNWRKHLSDSTKQRSLLKAIMQSKSENNIALPSFFDNMDGLQANKGVLALFCKNAYSSWLQSLRSLDLKQSDIEMTSPEVMGLFINAGLVDRDNSAKHFSVNSERMTRIADNSVQAFLAATYVTMQCLDKAYQNMGNVKEHSTKINTVVDSLVDVTKDIDDIFHHSDFIVFLCGLCPPIAHRFIKDINKVVNKNEIVHKNRQTFIKDVATELMLKDIQELSLICLQESLIGNEGIREMKVSDLFYDISIVKYLRYIVPEMIKSVHIYFSEVDDYDSLSKFIYHSHHYVNLRKFVIEDKLLHMTQADIGLIIRLLQKCSQTLVALSCTLSTRSLETYRKLFETFHTQLSNMTYLKALELSDITLSHETFSSLAAVVSRKLRLKQLRLIRISCNVPKCEGEDHVIYLTEYNDLKLLDIEGREITIADVNVTSLTNSKITNVSPTTEFSIFEAILRSTSIQSFSHKNTYSRPSFASKQLIKTLQTCDELQRVDLIGTNIASNEFTLDNLRSLSRLKLCKVTMTIGTWIGFINSLFLLPNYVEVHTTELNVIPNDEDLSMDGLNRPIQSETRAVIITDGAAMEMALDYVKVWSNEIRILLELPSILNFETVKTR